MLTDLTQLRVRYGESYRWYVLITVMLGTMASIMASTIVNVAVPDMSRFFSLGQEKAQWLSAGFMAAMTVSMPLTPWLLERHGYRRTYIGAILLLLAGSVVGGFANSYALVMAMRVVEGLAAGVLQPIPAIIIIYAFTSAERGKAMGWFGAAVVLAPALGPTIGGFLVEAFGWRAVFFVAAPLCLIALGLAWRLLPHSSPGHARVNAHGTRLDLAGLALAAGFILLLLNGLAQLHGRGAAVGAALLVASLAVLAVLVRHQHGKATPLMRLDLLSYRNFALGAVVSFIYGASLFGSTYLLPVFMLMALELPASQAGAVLLPAGIVLALVIPLVGRWATHESRRHYITGGLVLLSLSFILTATVGLGTALWLLVALAVVGRIGLGCILPSLNLLALVGVSGTLVPQAMSLINLLRQLGGAVGVSLVGVALEWRLAVHASDPVAAFHEVFVMLGVVNALAILAAARMSRASPLD
ncbi:MAG: DHA2 family efflux MFS transporter permease subunit [Burkholderiaceae bacterium]